MTAVSFSFEYASHSLSPAPTIRLPQSANILMLICGPKSANTEPHVSTSITVTRTMVPITTPGGGGEVYYQ